MFNLPEVTISGTTLFAVAGIAGAAYLMAPEIGTRLVANGNVLAECRKDLAAGHEAAASKARNDVEAPSSEPAVDMGTIARSLFGGRPGSEEFLRHYGRQFDDLGKAVTAPLEAQARAAKKALEDKLAEIDARLRRQASASESVCACRARLAINDGRAALTLFTASGGWIVNAPVNDWQAAMRAPAIVQSCGDNAS